MIDGLVLARLRELSARSEPVRVSALRGPGAVFDVAVLAGLGFVALLGNCDPLAKTVTVTEIGREFLAHHDAREARKNAARRSGLHIPESIQEAV
jgi:hypothetical protein